MNRRLLILFLCLLLLAIPITIALAHSGGLDANGGHRDRKTGQYHYHRGPNAGQSYSSKEDAQHKAGLVSTPSGTSVAGSTRSLDPRVDVLIRLLIEKEIVTQEEIDRALKNL